MNIYARDLYEAYRLPNIPPVSSLLPTLEQLQYDRGEERLMLAMLKDARVYRALSPRSWCP